MSRDEPPVYDKATPNVTDAEPFDVGPENLSLCDV